MGGRILRNGWPLSAEYALDEIDALDMDAIQYFDALTSYDGQHEQIQKATEDWICEVLHFRWSRDASESGIIRYAPRRSTLVPSSLLIEFFAHSLSVPGTYNRSIASGRAGINLYRIGEQFTDALAHYVRWDDRGQAFAMWRHEPSWTAEEGSEWIGFRFNYVVEADLAGANLVLAEHNLTEVGNQALTRRADALFPPFTETIYVDASMQEVEDAALLQLLRRPYSKRSLPNRDYSLDGERFPVIERLIGTDMWAVVCREARRGSEDLVRNRHSFRSRCERVAAAADKEIAKRVDQLRLRIDRQAGYGANHSATLSRDLLVEQSLRGSLVNGIREPRLRLDSVGFIVVSGRIPDA
jgi:ATP-dependent helicase HepA